MTPQLRTGLEHELREIERNRLVLKGLYQETIDTNDADGNLLYRMNGVTRSLQMAINELIEILKS